MEQDKRWIRVELDNRFEKFRPVTLYARPHKGWLAAIRGAIGMTAEQLGQRLGMSGTAILRLERRERDKTVQINTLERVAAALDCDLVYMFIPKTSLESFLDKQARLRARQHFASVTHSMLLEQQSVSESGTAHQFETYVADLKKHPKDIWM